MVNTYSLSNKQVWVAGHTGMVGSALLRRLEKENCDIITVQHQDLDLTDQLAVKNWLSEIKPQVIFLAAAKVGGIYANDTQPAEFLYINIMIETNIIHAAHEVGVEKLLFLGSSCVYPRDAVQPISEDTLLTGPLEKTNESYAIAKIAGIKLCQAYRRQHGNDYISVMPTNLYGPGDNFHPEHSHAPAALLRRIHEAKIANTPEVVVWGSGNPKREFLHVDDLADACVYLMQVYSDERLINVGTGSEISIREFAELIRDIIGYRGKLEFDTNRPDGTPRKLLDVNRLNELGWQAHIPLHQGLRQYYDWYTDNIINIRQ